MSAGTASKSFSQLGWLSLQYLWGWENEDRLGSQRHGSFRISALNALKRTIAPDDHVAWSQMCFSVSRPIMRLRPAKTAERIEITFWVETLGVPRNIVRRTTRGSRSPKAKRVKWGKWGEGWVSIGLPEKYQDVDSIQRNVANCTKYKERESMRPSLNYFGQLLIGVVRCCKVLRLINNPMTGAVEFDGHAIVSVLQHDNCSCRCAITPGDCRPPLHDYDPIACRCRCRRHVLCPQNKLWNEQTCTCVCRQIRHCIDDEMFDFVTCTYVEITCMHIDYRQFCIVKLHRLHEMQAIGTRLPPVKTWSSADRLSSVGGVDAYAERSIHKIRPLLSRMNDHSCIYTIYN